MIQTNKNGFLYVLDRTNCKLIAAHPYVKVNWATQIDMATGRPVLTDVQKRFLAGEEVEIWPSRGTNAVPIAFNPNTGLDLREHVERAAHTEARAADDQQSLAGPRPASSPGSRKLSQAMSSVTFAAINPLTGEKKWESPADRSAKFGRHAGNRRRACVHRQIDGRVHCARRGHGQNALAVQDRIERQFDGNHIHAQRPPVCDHRVGTRRHSCHSLCVA